MRRRDPAVARIMPLPCFTCAMDASCVRSSRWHACPAPPPAGCCCLPTHTSLCTTADPFAEAAGEDTSVAANKDYVHVRVQQRNGRKSLTTVQGIPEKYGKSKILKSLKKTYCCNGCVVEDAELGQVIQLQGDQRKNVQEFLTESKIVKKDLIKVRLPPRARTRCRMHQLSPPPPPPRHGPCAIGRSVLTHHASLPTVAHSSFTASKPHLPLWR